jgi:hypothetical protein
LAASRGPAQHHRLKRRQLAFIEPLRRTALGPIAQARHALGVEAGHPLDQADGVGLIERGVWRSMSA